MKCKTNDAATDSAENPRLSASPLLPDGFNAQKIIDYFRNSTSIRVKHVVYKTQHQAFWVLPLNFRNGILLLKERFFIIGIAWMNYVIIILTW